MASSTKKVVTPPKKIVPLAIIDPDHESSSILVKVLRKWHVFSANGGNSPVAVEMVLVDAEGTKIQGHLDKYYIYKHDKNIHEGSVYNISKFVVVLNAGKYRAARHEYKLNFNLKTVIVPPAHGDVPIPAYSFTPPEECFGTGFDQDYLVDIAGILIGIHQEQEFYKGTVKCSRMKIELDNRGYRFNITLFGEYVTELNQFISSGNTINAVIAVLFCKVGSWSGGISIQTTMHTTRLLINPDIPEAAALRENMSQAITSPTLTISQQSKSGGSQDDFLSVDQKYTIANVKEFVEVNDFVVLAYINAVVNDDEWYYWACRCSKKVVADSDMYYCPKCDTHVTNVTKKFFLKLRVIDQTDSVIVICFDHTARVLIGRSCDEVYDSWLEDPDRDFMPIELKSLKGKQALVKVQCEGTNGGRYPRSYRVRNISDNPDLISRYTLKWNDNEGAIEAPQEVPLIENTPTGGSGSVHKHGAELSQDLMSKFEQTVTDSNTVGRGKETVDITTDTDDTPPMKRKLPTDSGSSSRHLPIKSIKIEK